VGVIIRDGNGQVIATLCKTLMANLDPVKAKATAALKAVKFCRDVGCQDVILEGDSLSIVKAIASRDPHGTPTDKLLRILKCSKVS
jgi:ribonuclease HI